MIVVSLNETLQTATMLSLPRDLYVYIPGWTMARLNQAVPRGDVTGYPGGGIALLEETILYNFGIEVDHHVRVGFAGFKQLVDAIGGVEVPVSCKLRDWRLKSPDLDPQIEENWEQFELEPGVYHMDGDLALWYARSRRSSNDYERGRRQQQLLRAILGHGVEFGLLGQIPTLYQAYQQTVETDLELPEIAHLAALAPGVRANGVQNLFLTAAARESWRTPTGAAVQLLRPEGARPIFEQLMRPPLLNRAQRAPVTVEVMTADDVLFRLAAENLAYHGFVAVRGQPSEERPAHTEALYFGDNLKGSFDWLLSWVVGVSREEIVLVNDAPDYLYDYRVVLGWDYETCRPEVNAPDIGVGG
jgi:LCP family protein required for cell wall assembly